MTLRPRVALALAAVCAALTGCSGTADATATKPHYTADEVKAAYYTAKDAGEGARDYWYDRNFHSHTNYVPPSAIQTCPYVQRSDAANAPSNVVQPVGGEPVGQFAVEPARSTDSRVPYVTQNALVFGSGAIADGAMDEVGSGLAKCPGSYAVNGGPPVILGTYSVTSRPLEVFGWKGYVQQLAHTFPPGMDDVYYEDIAIVVLHRANLILYLDLTQTKIVGDRADSADKARGAVEKVLRRLG
ncbi:hypothetical protein [Microtetraspora fusca]|uniref:hypothetical protein n=1 Tax=Microtetraspora fusca TaxID=1997 RepID=UPI00082D8C49|nr:hypothetical protein [Microtetraspora fusca]